MSLLNNLWNSQRCEGCGKALLDQVGSQPYCRACDKLTSPIQQELKVVPRKYEPNSRPNRQRQSVKRIANFVRQFSQKYRIITCPQEFQYLVKKVLQVKQISPIKKGYRQTAAMVVYYELLDQIKLSVKDYCKVNQVNLRLFNQKYIVYYKLYKKHQKLKGLKLGDIKLEDDEIYADVQGKMQQITSKQQVYIEQEKEKPVRQMNDKIELKNLKHAIQVIFSGIFTKYYFLEKQQLIVEKLTQKVMNVQQKVLAQIRYSEQPTIKMYCIIFAVIKHLGLKMPYYRFADVVKQRTGYAVSFTMASQTLKIYEESVKANLEEIRSQSTPTYDLPVKEEADENYGIIHKRRYN